MKNYLHLIALAASLAAATFPASAADQYPAYYFGNTANNFAEPMQGETDAEFEARIPQWKMSTTDGVEYTIRNVKILDRYGVAVYDPGINIKCIDTGESFGAPAMDVHIGYGQEVEMVQTRYGYYVIPTTTNPIDVVFNLHYRTLIVTESETGGIGEVTVDSAASAASAAGCVYYNLQGQPVDPSAPGIYIMVSGGRATKIVR